MPGTADAGSHHDRRDRPAPTTTVEIELRKPGAVGYREAARRGSAMARALLRGQPALA
ncbi:hypothetical protein ACFWBB_24730 [Streptomyces sp. NPDC060000]|uniref:hypothetical protein n=1 Tax=Streptomyces sp. NPDC060000 TaxID=3347031 RepID=UPI0036C2E08D